MTEISKDDFPKEVHLIWNDTFENMRFTKRQQWVVTNYLLLLFGAVYFFFEKFGLQPTCTEKAILTLFVIVVFTGGVIFLFVYKNQCTSIVEFSTQLLGSIFLNRC